MAFDPITYNEVLSGKNPIGTLLRVVSDFNDPKYLDSGSSFVASEYPDLATKVPGGFQGDYVTEVPVGATPSNFSASSATLGNYMIGFMCAGKLNFLFYAAGTYVRYTSNTSDPADGISYNGTFTIPGGTGGAETNVPEFSLSSNGLFLYGSLADRHYRFDLSDPTLTTYKRFVLPTSLSRYKFADGNGLIMAAAGNVSVSGNIHYSSNDGDTWTVGGVATNTGGSSPQGFTFGAGVFVIVTAASTNNISRSADGVTWTTQTVGSIGHNNVKWNPILSLFVTTPFNSGAAYTSPTAVTWTARTSINGQQKNIGICSLAGDMITGPASSGSSSSSGFFRTTNAVAWTNRQTSSPFSNTSNNPYRGIYAVDCVMGTCFAFVGPVNGTGYGAMMFTYSTDTGNTWSQPVRLTTPVTTKNFKPPVIDSTQNKVILMEATPGGQDQAGNTWNGILSADGGSTWKSITISSGNDVVYWKEVLATNDGKFFAWGQLAHDTATSRCMCSAISSDGENWQYTSFTVLSASLQLVSPSSVAIGDDNRIYFLNASSTTGAVSADYGATWTQKSMPLTGGKLVSYKGRIIQLLNGQVPRYTVDGATTWQTGQLSATPASVPIGFASNSRVAVCTIASSTTFFYSYDGVIWIVGTLPASMPGTVGIINDWIMFPTGAGSIYRTKDFTNWDLVVIGEDNKYSTMALPTISSDPSGTTGFFHGPAAVNTAGYMLKADTEIKDRRRLPVIASDLPHTKWVVLAK